MDGVTFSFDENLQFVSMTVEPDELDAELDAKVVFAELKETEFAEVYLSRSTIKTVCDKANHYFKTHDSTSVTEQIGERRNAEVAFRIAEDEMTAHLSLTAPYGGHFPTLKAIMTLAQKSDVVRGVSAKRIRNLLQKLKQSDPGEVIDDLIAKGLPARDGHSSFMKPLVPNALERVLKPQVAEDGKADLRNLGEVVCVKAKVPVVRRMAPSQGRSGFTVKGKKIEATAGKWLPIKMGNGTEISEQDENLIVASISGMPKFQNLTMTVDDTFICKGVNVGSGHVTYDGAVLVNGDVAEKMRIVASGDVTVNGFVESAYIEAGGDIIITEGAMGKESADANQNTCVLKAQGSIHVQHGQGIAITCSGNVSIGRQLAYSQIRCGGSVTVGQGDMPRGNLFACDIESQSQIAAGTLGAVSGSTLKIDFSNGFNILSERIEAIDDLLKQMRENNSRHKERMDLIATKKVPKELLQRVNEARELFDNETAMLQWIETKSNELREAKEAYKDNVKIIATKKLYSGVSLKLNKRTWRSEREYDRCEVIYKEHQWQYEPLVRKA